MKLIVTLAFRLVVLCPVAGMITTFANHKWTVSFLSEAGVVLLGLVRRPVVSHDVVR